MPRDPLISLFLSAHPGLGFNESRFTALAGDVSSRRYTRLTRADGASIVCCVYPAPFDAGLTGAAWLARRRAADPDVALTWANDALAHLEATHLFAGAGLPVPAVVGVHGPAGVMAMVDVGDTRLQEGVAGADGATWRRWYAEAVDLAVGIDRATEAAEAQGGIAAGLALDGAKLSWEMAYFDRAFWGAYRRGEGIDPEGRARALVDLGRLCGWIGARPRRLCHRDYHARNLMIHGGEITRFEASAGGGAPRLVIIDHQDARLGPPTYDMVSLLEDPYTHPSPALQAELWARWAGATGRDLSAFEEERLAVTVQRLVKAAGTYAHQVAVRGDTSFEGHLPPTLGRALEALTALGGYPDARRALEAACRGW